MSERIERVRRVTRGAPGIPPVARAPRDPDRDRNREQASPARAPEDEPPPGDGLPHVDVRA
ncbi:MAG TPA: hypothetical protein VD931_18625 [Baekduia sp.]|nr:hypothetical protein [Baekduia sp.]